MILGIDTTTVACGVALFAEDIVAERSLYIRQAHSVKIITLVRDAMRDARVTPEHISAVAVSAGPGSFTGLRIGMATAKGLAFGWGKPVVPVPTLDALARTAVPWPGLVCTVLEARKGEVYAAVYAGMNGARMVDPLCCAPESLPSVVPNSNDNVLFLGDASGTYCGLLHDAFGARAVVPPAAARLPRAWSVCVMASEMLRTQGGVSPLEARPAYLRASEAEIAWSRKSASH
ncbi:MAG: tRNA (adenosine(37)-N6)-threonylcarbamoyltransferase complex dimerization subunit type 1 TsaB [Ignavibacteriales bacterium]